MFKGGRDSKSRIFAAIPRPSGRFTPLFSLKGLQTKPEIHSGLSREVGERATGRGHRYFSSILARLGGRIFPGRGGREEGEDGLAERRPHSHESHSLRHNVA